jgi:hypothetical protein
MSTPAKENRDLVSRGSHDHQTKEVTPLALSTAACAVCFLLAFTFLHGTEQLLLVSVGGMLIGGAR